MCEAVDLFRQSLAEEGLDAKVTAESTESTTTIHVSKCALGGDRYTISQKFSTSFRVESSPHDPTIEKRMALAARNVSHQFDDWITETISFDSRTITLKLYETPEATCELCNTTVGLPTKSMQKSNTGEMSVPQTIPLDSEKVSSSLSPHSQVLIKLYLIAKLRKSCKHDCPNSS